MRRGRKVIVPLRYTRSMWTRRVITWAGWVRSGGSTTGYPSAPSCLSRVALYVSMPSKCHELA
jgi:hypothetical protein